MFAQDLIFRYAKVAKRIQGQVGRDVDSDVGIFVEQTLRTYFSYHIINSLFD